MGYNGDSFYRLQELYKIGREMALQELSRRKPIPNNRVDQHIEEAVVNMPFHQPAFGWVRVSNELRKKGIFISAAGVSCVWQLHNLETFQERLKALESRVAKDSIILTEAQLVALELKREQREARGEIETEHLG